MAQAGLIEDRKARERARKVSLQQVINLGERAKAAKEILEIFMDGVEDDTLKKLESVNNEESLLYIRMYYKACLDLEKEFEYLIKQAFLAQEKIDGLSNEKGEK